MPTLPTIDVTQPQADRMLAAFGSVAGYRLWLKRQVIAQVLAYEQRVRSTEFRDQEAALDKQARIDLGDPDIPPEVPA